MTITRDQIARVLRLHRLAYEALVGSTTLPYRTARLV